MLPMTIKEPARHVPKKSEKRDSKIPEPIDLDPMLQQQPILEKGKGILIDQSPMNNVALAHGETSKLQTDLSVAARQNGSNLQEIDAIKGPNIVLDIDIRRNESPVMIRSDSPIPKDELIQDNDDESIEIVFDETVTPFTYHDRNMEQNFVQDSPVNNSDGNHASGSRD